MCPRRWGSALTRATAVGERPTSNAHAATLEVSPTTSVGSLASGGFLTPQALGHAEAVYERFTAESLVPVAGAIETLEWLTACGLRLGLVSNCAADMPRAWRTSAFAQYFDYCAFSCHVGAVKPDPTIYQAALDALSLLPEQTLYIGDGSDEELSGAARCGMQPVLITIDLSNTYDVQRQDVATWGGPVIQTLPELLALVTGTA